MFASLPYPRSHSLGLPSRSLAAILALLLTLPGCIQKTADANQSLYQFNRFSVIAIFLFGLVFFLASCVYGFRGNFKQAALMILGALVTWGLFMPAFITERVIVDARHVEVYGSPWQGSYQVAFQDMKTLKVVERHDVTVRRGQRHYALQCVPRDGSPAPSYPVNNALKTAMPEVLQCALNAGLGVEYIEAPFLRNFVLAK